MVEGLSASIELRVAWPCPCPVNVLERSRDWEPSSPPSAPSPFMLLMLFIILPGRFFAASIKLRNRDGVRERRMGEVSGSNRIPCPLEILYLLHDGIMHSVKVLL